MSASLQEILQDLGSPTPKQLILDTDTYNEIDDQFAIAYAMLAENIHLLGIVAAPFRNQRAATPAEGMEKSYREILRVRGLIDPENRRNIPAFRGSTAYMANISAPVPSEGAEAIVRLAKEANGTVYVAALGCFTNVASALLLAPEIAEKIVVLLVGANTFERGDCNEFNLAQDRFSARVIFECGVPVVVLPALGGTQAITTTNAELHHYLQNSAGEVGRYLCRIMAEEEGEPLQNGSCCSRTRIVWDIASVAALRLGSKAGRVQVVPARSITNEGHWAEESLPGREMIYVDRFDRDAIFSDFYTVLRSGAAE
ncbi:MAG: nucleoside hydrolase [Clostridia bacterium]|nr:nucleoside hydrolase [Clostridia bacterium]